MERPKFLDFDAKTLAAWRENQVTEAFLQWVALQADGANYECASTLRKGDDKKAMAIAGRAEANEEILRACHRQDPPVEVPEDPTMDPAFRFNPEMALNLEGTDAGTD